MRQIGWALSLVLLVIAGCFGARAVQNSYYVLHQQVPVQTATSTEPILGRVWVRDLETDRAYEKFQIVVRQSPFELRYSEANVWAVKPNQMIADILADELERRRSFTAVSRELIEMRPDFTLSGMVQAIEIYDSDEAYFAHLGMSLKLTSFATGETLWRYNFDDRKLVPNRDFPVAIRALSELLGHALDQALVSLARLDTIPRGPAEAPPTFEGGEPEHDDSGAGD